MGASNDGKEPTYLLLVYLKGKMTYNDLLAIGSASSRRSALFGSRKGSEERICWFVCLFGLVIGLVVCLFLVWFGLVLIFSTKASTRKEDFFALPSIPPPLVSQPPPSYHPK